MSFEGNALCDELDQMWDLHRGFVKRLLIGLAHDIDLADDLLQETYLSARRGIAAYRGGDARSWLAAIAKNAFYSHLRRKYVRSEVPLDTDTDAAVDQMEGHLHLLDLRQAVSDLSATFRTALILRHYGGYSYDEIADRLGCPVGTAKRRVSVALRKLRSALSDEREERTRMKCADVTDRQLLDYVYGKLSDTETARVREHLERCPGCGSKAEEIGKVLRALDASENDWRITSITELDEQGVPTSYISMSMPNLSDAPTQEIELGSSSRSGLSYVSVWGEEASFDAMPPGEDGKNRQFRVHLPRPAVPGERIDLLIVVDDDRPLSGEEVVVPIGDGRWRFGPGRLHLTEELAYVTAVRLPRSARLVETTPAPSEVRSNGRTTVLWRNTLSPDQEVEFWIEYRLGQKA